MFTSAKEQITGFLAKLLSKFSGSKLFKKFLFAAALTFGFILLLNESFFVASSAQALSNGLVAAVSAQARSQTLTTSAIATGAAGAVPLPATTALLPSSTGQGQVQNPTQSLTQAQGTVTPNQVSQGDLLLLQAQLQNQAQQLQQAQQDAFDSKNSASAAVTLSLIAILFGIIGLTLAVLATLRLRLSGIKLIGQIPGQNGNGKHGNNQVDR